MSGGLRISAVTPIDVPEGWYDRRGSVRPSHGGEEGCDLPAVVLAWAGVKRAAQDRSHRQVRARVEHVFARMKAWKILGDCRLKGDGVHHALLGIARLHNLALTG